MALSEYLSALLTFCSTINTVVPWGRPLSAPPAPHQVRGVFSTGQPTISDMFFGPVLKRPVMSIDAPVVVDGQVRYALGIGVLPEQFNAILQRQQLPPAWVASIIDRQGVVRFKQDMVANLERKAEQVVDARGAKRFTGEDSDFRPNVADGHIPGSRNVPFDQVLNADGTYKSPDEIRAAFAAAGVDLDQPIATTCGGGVTAAVLLFAMEELLGKRDVALYDGSWSDWGSDPETPKATGAA